MNSERAAVINSRAIESVVHEARCPTWIAVACRRTRGPRYSVPGAEAVAIPPETQAPSDRGGVLLLVCQVVTKAPFAIA